MSVAYLDPGGRPLMAPAQPRLQLHACTPMHSVQRTNQPSGCKLSCHQHPTPALQPLTHPPSHPLYLYLHPACACCALKP